jgi:pilus assembly protein CpaB
MNRRLLIMLMLALLFAGGAAWVADQWVASQSRSPTANADTVPVVVAALTLPFGRRVEGPDVKLVDWPKRSVPKGAFNDPSEVIGMVTKREFVTDEALVESRLAEHLGGSTLSALIEPGKRAISVRVNDVVGVAGFVLPGNQVDVLATRRESQNRAKTRTLLQNMKVLAVDQEASPEKDQPAVVRAVTLEMVPSQAALLTQAQKEGTLQLTLRNPQDKRVKVAEPPPPAPPPEPPPKPKVAPKSKPRPVAVRRPSGVGVISWGKSEEVTCKSKTC